MSEAPKQKHEKTLGTRSEVLAGEVLGLDAGEKEYLSEVEIMEEFNKLTPKKKTEKALSLLDLNNHSINTMLAGKSDFTKIPILASLLTEKNKYAIDNSLANNPTLPKLIHEKLEEKYDDPNYSAKLSGIYVSVSETAEIEKKITDAQTRTILKALSEKDSN